VERQNRGEPRRDKLRSRLLRSSPAVGGASKRHDAVGTRNEERGTEVYDLRIKEASAAQHGMSSGI
jgi:hypothetical protein